MAKQTESPVPIEDTEGLLRQHREDLGRRSMELTVQLEPLYEERDRILAEAERLRLEARQLVADRIRPIEEQLAPVRANHGRVSRVLGGRGLGDNPAT